MSLKPAVTAVGITDLVPNSPAARGGLQVSDLIVKVNGKRVRSPVDLQAAKEAATDGQLRVVYYSARERLVGTCDLSLTNGVMGVVTKRAPINLAAEDDRDDDADGPGASTAGAATRK